MDRQSLKLEEIFVYQKAMDLGKVVWEIVDRWNYFQKDTLGKQWIKSTDSVAANIAEGYGRYFYKENRLFCYYSRGSLMESRTWLVKAYQRNLVAKDQYELLWKQIEFERYNLNNYINSIGRR